jgi:membrane protein implicated in regulation of membrane protease activity
MGPGYVFRITHEGDTWRAAKIADFEQAVFVLAEVGASTLVVTGNSVYMMDRTGGVVSTYKGKWWGRYPNSALVLQQGSEILIGMDGVVVALRKNRSAGFDEKWYALGPCDTN